MNDLHHSVSLTLCVGWLHVLVIARRNLPQLLLAVCELYSLSFSNYPLLSGCYYAQSNTACVYDIQVNKTLLLIGSLLDYDHQLVCNKNTKLYFTGG